MKEHSKLTIQKCILPFWEPDFYFLADICDAGHANEEFVLIFLTFARRAVDHTPPHTYIYYPPFTHHVHARIHKP